MGRGIGLLSLLDRMEGESALHSRLLDDYRWCVVGRKELRSCQVTFCQRGVVASKCLGGLFQKRAGRTGRERRMERDRSSL
jgi:hypothetical protein